MRKTPKRKILFVCTGNIFRSFLAERCLRGYLAKIGDKNTIVNSAGTEARKQARHPNTIESLKNFGFDYKNHKQTRLTKKILEDHDLVIAMAKSHIDFMEKNFNFRDAVLFNKIANNKKGSVCDGRVIPQNIEVGDFQFENIKKTANYIFRSTYRLYKNLFKYFLFSDFITKRQRDNKKFPFITLYETTHSIAFMSISIPKKEDARILVVPKKRYVNFESIPNMVRKNLTDCIYIIASALKRHHAGYNILLNNGSVASQFINHVHFHIIPRDENDDIRVSIWRNKKLSKKEYIEFNKKMKNSIKEVLSKN